jgi:hypothetical protein
MNINIKTYKSDASDVWHFSRLVGKHSPRPVVLALALASVFGSLGMPNTVQAVTLYQTGFENPPFMLAPLTVSPVQGQDGWVAGATPNLLLNPGAALVTGDMAKSGHQSVIVHGADLVSTMPDTAPHDVVGSYRRPLNGDLGYTMAGTNKLARVDADLMLETTKPKTREDFYSMTLSARSGDGETLGEIGLSYKGIVEAYDFDAPKPTPAAPVNTPRFTRSIRFNKWYHITLFLDFANRTTSYFIDDHFLGTVRAPSVSNVLKRGSIVVQAYPDHDPRFGLNSVRSDYTSRFDNFRISVHREAPEF